MFRLSEKEKFYLDRKKDKNNLFLITDIFVKNTTTYKYIFEGLININTNYNDFLKAIQEEKNNLLPGVFMFVLGPDNIIYVFKTISNNISSSHYIYKFAYKPENEYMLNFCKQLFRFSEDKHATFTSYTIANNNNILMPEVLLRIIFTKAYIESQNQQLFTKFKKTSKNGKVREIIAPHELIKKELRVENEILSNIYAKRNFEFQTAYKKKKSIISGAELHKNHKYIFNIDLHDFYPSCKAELVRKFYNFQFITCFNRKFVEKQFEECIYDNGGLFIGNPCSGILANTVISKAVSYLKNICKKFNVELSVYADDITFSSDKFISENFVKNLFNKAFSFYGLDKYFVLNEKKSIGLSGCNRKITGVVINENNEITVKRAYFRLLRTQLDHLSKGEQINVEKLRGRIAYALMVDKTGKVYKYLQKYLPTVKQYNLCSDEKMNEIKEKLNII